MDCALCSISLKKASALTDEERTTIQSDICAFVAPFVDLLVTPVELPADNLFEISFECHPHAYGILYDYLYYTKKYDESYDLSFDFNKLEPSLFDLA